MIFKRYGDSIQSVDPNFESKALNEIGFRRDREASISVEDLDAGYERLTTHELVASAEGYVQDHTEQLMLDRLEEQLLELEESLGPDVILLVDNADGPDYPKTRQEIHNVIVDGENRLSFSYTVAPPLRVVVYRRPA